MSHEYIIMVNSSGDKCDGDFSIKVTFNQCTYEWLCYIVFLGFSRALPEYLCCRSLVNSWFWKNGLSS